MNVSNLASYVVYPKQIVADYLIAQIVYFLNEYKLMFHAAYHRQEVGAPNVAPRDGVGELWLLREPVELRQPNVEPIKQLESEMETGIPAERTSEIETEIRKEENRGKQSSNNPLSG